MTENGEDRDNTLREVARNVYDEYGNSEEALEAMTEIIVRSKDLTTQAITMTSRSLLLECQRKSRIQITRESRSPVRPKTFDAAFHAGVAEACASLLDFPMMDGSTLGKATRDHVLSDRERYQEMAEGNLRRATFLSLVAAKMEEGQKVEEVYSPEQLRLLLEVSIRAVVLKTV